MDVVIELPGRPDQVRVARARLRDLLRRTPRVDDAVLIASELVTIALSHTGGRAEEGLRITVSGLADPEAGWCRIAVRDSGRASRQGRVPGRGRLPRAPGVVVVSALADCFGARSGPDGSVVWADVRWGVRGEGS